MRLTLAPNSLDMSLNNPSRFNVIDDIYCPELKCECRQIKRITNPHIGKNVLFLNMYSKHAIAEVMSEIQGKSIEKSLTFRYLHIQLIKPV